MSHTSSGLHASPWGWMNERAVRLAGGGVRWLRGHVLCQFLNGTLGVFTLKAIVLSQLRCSCLNVPLLVCVPIRTIVGTLFKTHRSPLGNGLWIFFDSPNFQCTTQLRGNGPGQIHFTKKRDVKNVSMHFTTYWNLWANFLISAQSYSHHLWFRMPESLGIRQLESLRPAVLWF